MKQDELFAIVFFLVAISTAYAFGLFGRMIGRNKSADRLGFWLGALLGPVGLILAAVAIDGRKKCPVCRERVNESAEKCGHCREPLVWFDAKPLTQSQLMLIARKR